MVWKKERGVRRTAALHAKGEDVAQDEDLGEPVGPDDGVLRGVEAGGEAPEDHVDGGGEERGAEEEEERLDDVRVLGVEGVLAPGEGAADVAYCFDFCGVSFGVRRCWLRGKGATYRGNRVRRG